LYVDEVNLLDDGLVDVVLDSSASGVNTVEREGISIAHPAKFIMIGSGNPAVSSSKCSWGPAAAASAAAAAAALAVGSLG
jgi:Mg-chelatase subunit ChlI